jgi:hypothetical protein
MKLSTKIHGIIDYPLAVLLIASPWLFDFSNAGVPTGMAITLGAITLLNNLLTNYEFGAIRIFSMEMNLLVDMISAIVLGTSSWLLASDSYTAPFLCISLIQAVTSLMSSNRPYAYKKTNNFQPLKISGLN